MIGGGAAGRGGEEAAAAATAVCLSVCLLEGGNEELAGTICLAAHGFLCPADPLILPMH